MIVLLLGGFLVKIIINNNDNNIVPVGVSVPVYTVTRLRSFPTFIRHIPNNAFPYQLQNENESNINNLCFYKMPSLNKIIKKLLKFFNQVFFIKCLYVHLDPLIQLKRQNSIISVRASGFESARPRASAANVSATSWTEFILWKLKMI